MRGGLIGVVIGMIMLFYVVAYTWEPLETAEQKLGDAWGNSSISAIAGMADLPDVALMLFGLVLIFGIIAAARSRQYL